MKRIKFVAIAATLAIMFSAFTTTQRQPDTFYYKTGPTTFEIYPALVCPAGSQQACLRPNPDGPGNVTIYTAPNDNSVLKYNP